MGLLTGRGLKNIRNWKKLLGGAAVWAGLAAGSAGAEPSNPTVRHGNVNVAPGVHTQIQQLTDRAIVDWQSFSIGEAESVTFLQPSQLSVILNRVTGGDASAILGTLEANGNIFLINPNGILFGPNSTVSVGGLVASTLNVTDQDFLAGNYSFFQEDGVDLGAVVNQGQIRITDGGYAVLTAPTVVNEGTIIARAGNVVLASGEQATLNLDGRDLIHFALGGQVSEGPVLLAPGALSERLSDVVGVNPNLRADSLIQDPDGTVRMIRSSGTTIQAGTVSADGFEGRDAGSVLLDSSDVTILADGSVTSASGSGIDSNGGDVLVLSAMDGNDSSRGFTDVQSGSFLAASGGDSGDGGFIEVSGDALNLHGDFDLAATNGEAGRFLLDPVTITIVNGDNAPSSTMPMSDTLIGHLWFAAGAPPNLTLESTGDILFDLEMSGTNPVNFTVANPVVDFGGNNVTLLAGTDAVDSGNIEFKDFISTDDARFVTYQGLTGLTLDADGDILATNSTIQTTGDTTLSATGNVTLDNVSLSAAGSGDDILIDTDGAVTFSSGTKINDGLADNGGPTEATGTFKIDAGGAVSLGDTEISVDVLSASEPFRISSGGILDMGSSDIYIEATLQNQSVVLETTGTGNNLDLGSSSLSYRESSNGSITIAISATGDLIADSGVGVVNTYVLPGDATLSAGGSIFLPNFELLPVLPTLTPGSTSLLMDAQGGALNLRDSHLEVNGATTLQSTADMTLDNLELSAAGNILIDTDGAVTLVDGLINDGLADNGGSTEATGTFKIDAGGAVSLGDTEISVDVLSASEPFTISSGGILDMGSSDIYIEGTLQNQNVVLETTGAGNDLDLGSSRVEFKSMTSGLVTSTIRSSGGITSDPADSNPFTFTTELLLEGQTLIEAADGEVQLFDVDILVNDSTSLDIVSESGGLNLGESRIATDASDISFQAQGVLDAAGSAASSPGQITFASNTEVRSSNSAINAGDIEIFGFNSTTGMLDPTMAVPNGVTLDLVGDVDISILSDGDIVINHSGGNLTTERAGLESAGTMMNSPSSIRSTGGSITIVSDGSVLIGKGGGLGAPLVSADSSDAVVSITADQIVDAEGGLNLDLFSGGSLSLTASTSIGGTGALEVQGQSVIIDVSSVSGTTADVTIFGDTDFLKVAGNASVIQVDENTSGNTLDLIQAVNGSRLTVEALTIEDIYYIDQNGVELDGVVVGPNQSVAVEALNGDITSNVSSGNVIANNGDVTLVANGSIGDQTRSIAVSGATLATRSTADTFIESDSDVLIVGQVALQDHLGNPQLSEAGVTAGGDIELKLTGTALPTRLSQDEDIVSTAGNVAIDLVNGSLVQADGKTIKASTLAIRTEGHVGEFDGTAVQDEVNIEADSLVLNVGGDAILHQQNSDLSLIQQVTIGGELYETEGALGDLRVRSPQGGISVETDIQSGGQAALVTGNNLTLNQGSLPNSINLNGSITAVESIVLLSAGDINYTSGFLNAPRIGLGAVGSIGSTSQPVQLQTDSLSTAPFEAQVNDPNGFTLVDSVSATGVTVNQALPLPEPVEEPPQTLLEPGTVVVDVRLEPLEDDFGAVFAQNNVDLIEDFLRTVDDILIDDIEELDPTRPPTLWPEDDFLQKKFRGR